jgi:hypothetical protein
VRKDGTVVIEGVIKLWVTEKSSAATSSVRLSLRSRNRRR